MNGYWLSVQEVAHFRTVHEADPWEPAVTHYPRAVGYACERRRASGARSEQRAAPQRPSA